MTVVRLDPFQNIVGVGWASGGPFAVLQFDSVWRNGSSNPNQFSVSVPQLGTSFPIYGHTDYRWPLPDGPALVKSIGPFHAEELSGDLDSDTTVTVYHSEETWNGPGPLDSGFSETDVTVTTVTTANGSSTIWSAGAGSGIGGLEAYEAYVVEHATGLSNYSFSTAIISGPTTTHHAGDPAVHDTDNALLLFDIKAIRARLGPSVDVLDIVFTPGAGPGTVHDPDHLGIIGYVWAAVLTTFAKTKAAKFTVDAFNMPSGAWPASTSSGEADSLAEQPTPSADVAFQINLTTLAVTGGIV